MAGKITVAADFDSLPGDIADAAGMPERVRRGSFSTYGFFSVGLGTVRH
jgi:hypothetical protein